MKKKFIIIIAIIGWNYSFSQSDSSITKIHFGIESFAGTGTIYNDLTPTRDIDTYINEYRINYMGGMYGIYNISSKSSIELDLLYNRINSFWGFHVDDVINGENVRTWTDDNERKFYYLSLPITYRFALKKFNINLGCQYSFLIKNLSHYCHNDISGTEYHQIKNYSDLIKSDLSLTFFLSYQISKKYFIVGRYNQGFINTANTNEGYVFHSYSRQFFIGVMCSIYEK